MSKTFFNLREELKESIGRFAFDMKSRDHMNAAKASLKKAGFNSRNRPGHSGGDHVLHVKGKAADIHKVMKHHAPHMHDAAMGSVGHMDDDTYGHRLESVSEGPFKGIGKMMMKRKLNKNIKKADAARDAHSIGYTTTPRGTNLKKYHRDGMDKADAMMARLSKAKNRLNRPKTPDLDFN
jgi:hypothetical protein